MSNQDTPANPITDESQWIGETKREKAFWLLYSQALVTSTGSYDLIAQVAIEAVNAGFKALESE
jgi:hypothetical protein